MLHADSKRAAFCATSYELGDGYRHHTNMNIFITLIFSVHKDVSTLFVSSKIQFPAQENDNKLYSHFLHLILRI